MIKVTTEHQEGKALEGEVEEDIAHFNVWFQKRGNDPLARSEVAILKTFLWFKTRGAKEEADTEPPPPSASSTPVPQ